MPFYPFVLDGSGLVIHRFYSMATAPSIGHFVNVVGRKLRRVPSDFQPSGLDCDRTYDKYPYKSHALPREAHMPDSVKGVTRFTKTGAPIIRSKQHEKEVAAALNMNKM